MPPENLVDYTASPEEPSLDAMRYALAQRGATPNQQQRPLDGVTDTFKRLAAEFNPLMMGRTLQDAPKIMYNAVAAPVAGTWAGVLRNLQAAGAAQAYGALGMPQDAAAAQSRTQPVTPQSGQLKLRSSAGQQTQEALGEAFNALQLPPVGPGSGMPGTAPLNPRPMLTPNDVRVMGAKATHAVREAGQIPTDIANVRGAGIQRLSPLTGQPSVGSRIGSAIEGTAQTAGRVGDVARDVGQSTADYMQMRRDMGLSPVPGVPPEFFPDLNLYAMRPKDSTLVTPSVPPTKNVTSLDVGNAPYAAIHDVGADRPELRPSDALAYLSGMDLDVPRTNAQGIAPITSERQAAFNAFIAAQANALYPDAPNSREAMLAMDDRFSRQADRDASRIQLYDAFRDSPEGKAVGMDDLPSSTELQARHAAASQWLNSTLLNYAKRKLGAEGDPLVQQASQGFTMLPAENVRILANAVNEDVLKRRRAQAGMPVAGTVAPAIRDKSVELADATAAVAQLQQRREEYRDLAMQQGLPDPAQLPEYAATTNPLRVAVAKRDKLQEELNNLQLGRDYEKLSDIAVTVDTQPNLLGKIEYPQRQFYPSVTRARPDETLFHLSRTGPLQSTGFNELAAQFYDDVIRGDIPIDKLKSLTVEKYVRSKAEGRVAEEKRQAQATAALKNSIESRMQQDMQRYVKPEDYFGNVGVLELSTSTGFNIDEIRRLISDDTLVLDHCVAEGPTPGSKAKNLWNGEDRRYMPLVDPVTGQLLPDSPRDYTRYMRHAGESDPSRAGMLASVRDKNTGLPVATIEFQRNSNGTYSIGYASGYRNGHVKNEYHEAIKEYLNSRADMIEGSGSDLPNVGLIDLHSAEAVGDLQRILSVPRRDAEALLDAELANGTLPRFGTRDDLRQIFTVPQTAPVVQQSAARQPAAQQGITAADLYNYLRDVAQAYGRDEGNAVLAVLRQVRQSFDGVPSYEDLLRVQPTAFAERIADLALEQGSAIVGQSLLELADRIAPQVPPAQPLNPPEAWPLVGQQLAEQQPEVQGRGAGAPLVPSTRLAIDDAFELAARGLQGDPSAIELLNDLENDIRGTYLQPNATINDLRSMRIRLENTYDRFSNINRPQFLAAANALYNDLLPAINAIIEPPAVPVNAPVNARVGERQPLTFDARSFAQDLLEDARLDNQTFNVADLSTTLFTLDNGNFDDARFRALGENNAVSQRTVAGHLRQLMQDAGIPLPFAQQPAAPQRPALGVFEEFAIARDLLEDARLDNTTFNVPALRGMLSALENGRVNDPRLSAAAQLEVATALRQMMQDAGIPLPASQQPAAPQQPTPQAQALIDNVRAADLADIVNFIEPNRWPLITARADQAAQGVYPADAATITEAIRNGQMPDITDGLDIIERELVAREVQQRIDDNARRQRPIAAQQPVVDTQAYIAQVRDNYGDVVGDSVAREVRAAQTAAVTAADVPIILRNTAAQTLDPVVEDALLNLAAQFETQLTGAAAPEDLGDWEPDPTHPANRPAQPPPRQQADERPERQRPFPPGGAAATRGVPLGNLNIQPATTAAMLRGPDTQPLGNFIQQFRALPGVTHEGSQTALLGLERMDPTLRVTKSEFIRELVPSSYDIVDLKGASQDNQHLMDAAQDEFDQDASPVGDVLGLEGAQLAAWANAVRTQYNDYDSFPASVKRALAKQGVEDADAYVEAYDIAYRDALEAYVANYTGNLANEEGYTYSETQRLVQPSMGDEYGEFGVTHPDQRGVYHHFDLAPEGVIGHFRGTYNPADPLTLTYWDQQGNQQHFETPNNSYAIEEIQSDAQKIAQQTGHLHQAHGVLFKAAIQKALELGANTVYLPTASIIARTRGSQPKKFAPIYDQAIVKEGLKPLLKIPGVTSKMVNGYHEISFTPEAIERILYGQGQTVPGYNTGGSVRKSAYDNIFMLKYANGGTVPQTQSLDAMKYELMMRSK